jgi:hypothetical protein
MFFYSLHNILTDWIWSTQSLNFLLSWVVILGRSCQLYLGAHVLIVDAALSSSALWSSVKVLHLTENMCLKADGLTDDSRAELAEFSEWVRPVGNGTV